ncbi:SURF1 family protein [Rothia sp. AR01]|uniref:SURF1-like protein n=1 Tax=Rothia santali TaxID=2949643 RepID=A0A9X2HGP5_9MICC|nr:SURF1 family protein [Rothia santali]MCP3424518.1 SURF1 family protein [Rothia santali]
MSGKWIGAFLLCVLFSLLCVYLAGWQMDRKEALDYTNSRIADNYDAAPASFAEAGGNFARMDPDLQWQQVTMTGSYRAEDQALVRNRPHNGQVGFEVLVPFTTQEGETVVVDRGWVATGDDNAAPAQAVPAPPAGTVTVTARLHSPEAATGRNSPEGQLPSIDLTDYAQRLDYPIQEGAYGIMSAEDPSPAERPQPLAAPEQDAGPNLSYSLQWYAFAVLIYVAYGWCARQKVRNDRMDAELVAELEQYYGTFYDEDGTYVGEDDEAVVRRRMDMIDDMPRHMKAIVRPRPARKRRGITDEEAEDAALDAAEAARRGH